MGRTNDLVSLIQRRVERADYTLGGLPAERELAAEAQVSRKTARKAIQTLIERGLLDRSPNGRVVVRGGSEGGVCQLALLKPAINALGEVPLKLFQLADQASVRLRPVEFVHWDDPVIGETLSAFSGVFVMPPAEPIPEAIVDRFRSSDAAVVVLNSDVADLGLRCVDTCPTQNISTLLDHLRSLGHTQIDCINTQPQHEIIQARIDAWVRWRVAHGIEGQLYNQPVRSYEDARPAAYRLVGSILKDQQTQGGPGLASAVLCTTTPAAVAAMRRFSEAGLRVGHDISVAAFDNEGVNRFLTPSLACLQQPDPTPYVKQCLDWMIAGGHPSEWEGPLLLRPESIELFAGESVGPPANP
ncbi:MAG: substrate-binding domain-containing protein [Planctomycetota bacterium]